jgi:6-phosphogluconolactonase (cycloisomerase 2 family)
VAQRTGAIAIYNRNRADENYAPEPIFEIRGPQSKLAYSDGVSFVPPNNDYLAACNLELGTILFFRMISLSPVAFQETPEFELKLPRGFNPDGLAFSRCGRWLATANHGKGSVSIFQRGNRIASDGKFIYGPKPLTVIEDPQFRYPHSVAFTPRTNHLIVTNAGANYFNVYEPRPHDFGMRWSQSPVAQVIAHDDEAFQEANTANKMEGGPKGVAVYENNLAVCSPQIGVKIYCFREQP